MADPPGQAVESERCAQVAHRERVEVGNRVGGAGVRAHDRGEEAQRPEPVTGSVVDAEQDHVARRVVRQAHAQRG